MHGLVQHDLAAREIDSTVVAGLLDELDAQVRAILDGAHSGVPRRGRSDRVWRAAAIRAADPLLQRQPTSCSPDPDAALLSAAFRSNGEIISQ